MPDNPAKADTAILSWQTKPFGTRVNVVYIVTAGMQVNIAYCGAGCVGLLKDDFGSVK